MRRCVALGIRHKLTKVRRPQTNGKVERFHGIVDSELYLLKRFKDQEDRKQALKDYLKIYNCQRPHMGIGGLTPTEKLILLNGSEVKLQAAQKPLGSVSNVSKHHTLQTAP